MPGCPLTKKMGVKPGQKMLVMNAPEGYRELLGRLPEGTALSLAPEGEYDFVQLFVRDSLELEAMGTRAISAVRRGELLWLCYPKKSSGVNSDLTRDEGWELVSKAGLRPVSQVAVDETWSAVRFRPVEDVKPRRNG